MAYDAADLVIKIFPWSNQLLLRLLLLGRAGRGQEMHDRLDVLGFLLLRKPREHVRHRGPWLGRCRVAHEFAEVARSDASAHAVEKRRGPKVDRRLACR